MDRILGNAEPTPSYFVLREKKLRRPREEASQDFSLYWAPHAGWKLYSRTALSPIYHRGCHQLSHSSQMSETHPYSSPSHSQQMTLLPFHKPTYTFTCKYNHLVLLLEGRGEPLVQTNSSHMCSPLPSQEPWSSCHPSSPIYSSFPSFGSSPLIGTCCGWSTWRSRELVLWLLVRLIHWVVDF